MEKFVLSGTPVLAFQENHLLPILGDSRQSIRDGRRVRHAIYTLYIKW